VRGRERKRERENLRKREFFFSFSLSYSLKTFESEATGWRENERVRGVERENRWF